jgi:hypothetical protein
MVGIEGSCVGSAGTVSSGMEGSSIVGIVEGIAGIDGSSVAGMDGMLTVGMVAGNELVGSMDGIKAIRDCRRPVSMDGRATLTAGIEGIVVNVRVGNGDGSPVPDARVDWEGRIPAGTENPPNWRLRAAAAVATKNIIEIRNISSGS